MIILFWVRKIYLSQDSLEEKNVVSSYRAAISTNKHDKIHVRSLKKSQKKPSLYKQLNASLNLVS